MLNKSTLKTLWTSLVYYHLEAFLHPNKMSNMFKEKEDGDGTMNTSFGAKAGRVGRVGYINKSCEPEEEEEEG